jgi:AcrR family transcriptional regulator
VVVSRLSRAELQLRTRAKVLAAARAEFAEHGYRDATIDRIADRADLTRGAVYSNFAGKRALYLTALADQNRMGRGARRAVSTPAEGLAAFAWSWFDREHPGAEPDLADFGTPYASLLGFNAVLLGLGLDALSPGDLGRRIQISRLALTLLTGATQVASAPGFVRPLAVARACAGLADLDVDDPWTPPPTMPPVRPAHESWSPPSVTDEVLRRTAEFGTGVVAILGLNRLAAAEDVVRSTGAAVTIALVSSDPSELGPLTRYTTDSLLSCLRQSAPLPRVQVVHDERGVLASAVGCEVIGDDLEYAVAIADDRIAARAEGFGAGAAIASTQPARHVAAG